MLPVSNDGPARAKRRARSISIGPDLASPRFLRGNLKPPRMLRRTEMAARAAETPATTAEVRRAAPSGHGDASGADAPLASRRSTTTAPPRSSSSSTRRCLGERQEPDPTSSRSRGRRDHLWWDRAARLRKIPWLKLGRALARRHLLTVVPGTRSSRWRSRSSICRETPAERAYERRYSTSFAS